MSSKSERALLIGLALLSCAVIAQGALAPERKQLCAKKVGEGLVSITEVRQYELPIFSPTFFGEWTRDYLLEDQMGDALSVSNGSGYFEPDLDSASRQLSCENYIDSVVEKIQMRREQPDSAQQPQAPVSYGVTALMLAAGDSSPDFVKSVLATVAADEIDRKTALGATALMYAASAGRTENVALLLRAGADKTLKDKNGDTALDMARLQGFSAIIALLE